MGAVMSSFVTQSKISSSIEASGSGSALLDNLFKQTDVIFKGHASCLGQGVGRQGTAVGDTFGDGHVTCLLKGADMGREITVGHLHRRAYLGEAKIG